MECGMGVLMRGLVMVLEYLKIEALAWGCMLLWVLVLEDAVLGLEGANWYGLAICVPLFAGTSCFGPL